MVVGLLGGRVVGLVGGWVVGLLGCWVVGLLDCHQESFTCRIVGGLGRGGLFFVGLLARWIVGGTLGIFFVGWGGSWC